MKKYEDIIIELSEKATKFAMENQELPYVDFDHLPFSNFTFYYPMMCGEETGMAKGFQSVMQLARENGIKLDPIQFARMQSELKAKKIYVTTNITDEQIFVSMQDDDRSPMLEFRIRYDDPKPLITFNYMRESKHLKNNPIGDDEEFQMAIMNTRMMFNVLGYLVKPKEEVKRVRPIKDEIKTASKRVQYRGKGKQTRYLTKKVYVVDTFDQVVPEKTGEKRTYTRKTESWDVCGHWRTYKSGKRSWIAQGVRGNKNKQTKPREVKIANMSNK